MEQIFLNTCSTYSEENDGDEYVFLAAIMTVMFLMAFTSNIILMVIILKNPKLRTVPNKLVLNLSVCGLFTVIVNGPFVVSTLISGRWLFRCEVCSLNGFTTTVYGFAAIVTLATISVSRYQLVRLPSQRRQVWITAKRLPYVIAGTWLFSCLLALPPLFGWSRYEYVPVRAICTLKWSTNHSYTIFIFLFGVALPFSVTVYSYFKIFLTVSTSFRNLKSHRSGPGKTVKTHNVFHEMTTSPAQFVLAQYLSQCSSRDAGNQEKSGSKKSLWLQKKNKIRPNDNPSANMATASALDVHRNLVENCLGKEYLEEPSVDKERAVDRTRPDRDKSRVIKTRINVMDRNRLLLLQLEQSMKRPQNKLRPLPTLKALPEMNDGAQKPSAKKRTSQSGGVKTKRRKTSRDCKHGKREVNKRPNDDKTSEGEIRGDESNLPVTCEERRLYQKGDVIFPKCNPEITVTGAKPEVDDGRESSTQCSSKSSDGGSNSKPLLQSDKEDSQRRDIWIISGDTMATVIPTQQSGAATSRKLFPVGFGKSSSLRGLNCSSNMKDELKVTVMLFIILTSFIVCWAPIAIVNFMETIQSSQVSSWMNKFSVFMMFFSSLINPITYGVLNRNFRREFYDLCSLGCASEQPRSGGETDHRAKHRVFTI